MFPFPLNLDLHFGIDLLFNFMKFEKVWEKTKNENLKISLNDYGIQTKFQTIVKILGSCKKA